MLRWLNRWHEVSFVGLTANRSQQKNACLANEYSADATWVSSWLASPTLPRSAFYTGALLNLVSPLPYAVSRFTSGKLRQKLTELLRSRPFDVLVSDFLFPSSSLPWGIKRSVGLPWVLFQHNVEAVIWKRRCEGASGIEARYLRSQWNRMKSFELKACRQFDGIITVSEGDSTIHRDEMKLSNVLGSVPTGVDADYFTSVSRRPAKSPTVVFVGSMDWLANVDAVTYFVSKVWPRVRNQLPDARLQIVGRQPPPSIQSLATGMSGIEVTGTVPDVRPYMRNAHAMVVPLRIGGGTRLKILEAMAAELPVISTRVGAEGLPVKSGHHLLLADEPGDMAQALIEVLVSNELADDLRNKAYNEIAIPQSWEASARQFENMLLKVPGIAQRLVS